MSVCHSKFVFESQSSPGFNFINVLHAAFGRADPEIVKETVKSSVFFMLLGSALAKAVHKHVGEIDPWFQFQALCL